MILVFDLDDTLYNESTYVLSGMRAVAKHLHTKSGVSEKVIYDNLVQVLEEQGRGKVFNEVLKTLNLFSKKNVKDCVTAYRLHEPKIELSKEGKACLERFKDQSKYLVTDGHKIVQLKKIQALKLEPYFKKMYRTYQYGLKYSKPSTFCFQKIAALEKTSPQNIVYIGDNPNKDFINIKKEGFKTIRLRNGMFKDLTLDQEHEAHKTILSLNELTEAFIKDVL